MTGAYTISFSSIKGLNVIVSQIRIWKNRYFETIFVLTRWVCLFLSIMCVTIDQVYYYRLSVSI